MPHAQKHFGSRPNVVANASMKIRNQCLGSQTIFFTCDEMKVLLEDFFILGH